MKTIYKTNYTLDLIKKVLLIHILITILGLQAIQAAPNPTPPPEPTYIVHIQAIRTADDDGSNPGTVTAAQIEKAIPGINEIYKQAGIQFRFNSATDFVHIKSTKLNNEDEATRRSVADRYRGKITIFFRNYANKTQFTGRGRFISWNGGMSNKSYITLAHEIGHYMYSVHPFHLSVSKSLQEAKSRIKAYVSRGNPISEGLNALDGDRPWFIDTPADVGVDLFRNQTGSSCGQTDYFDIPVYFPVTNVNYNYKLKPDRGNMMSYFNCSNFNRHFSTQQINRMRDALENLNRHDLISSATSNQSQYLQRQGKALAGAVDKTDIVRVGLNRVVTATIKNGTLVLIAWDINNDGKTIERLGFARFNNVIDVSVSYMGLGHIAATVRSSTGYLKVITWNVSKSGNISKVDESNAGKVREFSSVRVGAIQLVTAARNAAGNLEMILWNVTADGKLTRGATAYAGKISEVSLARTDTFNVVTTVRNASGNLKVISWKISGDIVSRAPERKASAYAGWASELDATTVATDLITTSVRNGSGHLQVDEWFASAYGHLSRKAGITLSTVVSELDSTRLSTNSIIIAARNIYGNLELNLIDNINYSRALLTSTDRPPRLKARGFAGRASNISIARAGTNSVVTAIRNGSGNLQLDVWEPKYLQIFR